MIHSPEPLDAGHETTGFESGVAALDEWLKRRALRNQVSGASRTFVACESRRVVGYYAVSSGAVSVEAAPGRFRRNMPDPIPVVLLGRLAVDAGWQGRGLGRAMIGDAARRVAHAASSIGIRGMLVHALSEDARAFYEKVGFHPSSLDTMTLMIPLQDLNLVISA